MQEGWINTELDLSAFAPTKRLSIAFNCFLLIVGCVYLVVYVVNDMTWLISGSFLCFALLALSFVYVLKGPDMRFIGINVIEIAFFMVMNVVFLGTELGFQLYAFSFIAAAMLLSLSAGGRGKVLLPTKILIAVMVLFYTAVTLWFKGNAPLYSFQNSVTVNLIFMLNSLATMATIIMFTGVYMATTASLASRLSDVALHDALTGLLNRHGFYPIVAEAFERSSGEAGMCYLAMLDIDKFKDVNDTYGHDGGDAVLKRLADLFRERMAQWPTLQVSRWGGEEFLLLYIKDEDDDTAEGCPFEMIRSEVENTSVEFEGKTIRWTVTIGVADFVEGKTPDATISLSDERLYQGKQGGRNCVVYGEAHSAQNGCCA